MEITGPKVRRPLRLSSSRRARRNGFYPCESPVPLVCVAYSLKDTGPVRPSKGRFSPCTLVQAVFVRELETPAAEGVFGLRWGAPGRSRRHYVGHWTVRGRFLCVGAGPTAGASALLERTTYHRMPNGRYRQTTYERTGRRTGRLGTLNGFETATERWHDYYVVGGGAAAVLLGLLFVSLSLHLDREASEYDVLFRVG